MNGMSDRVGETAVTQRASGNCEVVAADAGAITRATALLRAGALVAFPTETVYGLGADARSDAAVAAIFAAKGRPAVNPLIVHYPSAEAAAEDAVFDARAHRLAGRFWPGPLTLVLPRRGESAVSRLVGAGLATLAVRVPGHPVARALLSLAGVPVAAPSANPSGRLSPTTAAHVAAALGGRVALVLDGGPTEVGLESTIVDLAGRARLLRPGGLTAEDIAAEIGPLADAPDDGPVRAPGMLASHYAPGLPLRLGARRAAADEAALGFAGAVPEGAALSLNLSPRGDLAEAAANLYAMLHALDRPPFAGIAVAPIPARGLGLAINDRLRRAAAPR